MVFIIGFYQSWVSLFIFLESLCMRGFGNVRIFKLRCDLSDDEVGLYVYPICANWFFYEETRRFSNRDLFAWRLVEILWECFFICHSKKIWHMLIIFTKNLKVHIENSWNNHLILTAIVWKKCTATNNYLRTFKGTGWRIDIVICHTEIPDLLCTYKNMEIVYELNS